MSNNIPTQEQLEMLIDFLQQRRFLVTGYNRTAFARQRNRAAWQQVARILNSAGGAVKTWSKWSKYWKDKKAAVKKKFTKLHSTKQQTGGVDDVDMLSELEERIVTLMRSGSQLSESEQNPAADPLEIQLNMQDFAAGSHVKLSRSIFSKAQSPLVEPGTQHSDARTDFCVPSPPSAQPRRNEELNEDTNRASSSDTSPRSSPPGQLRSISERFIAIEEERLEMDQRRLEMDERRLRMDQTLIDNQREMVLALRSVSDAWLRQTQLLLEILNRTNET